MKDSLTMIDKFNELKQLILDLELDANKNYAGNISAGLRFRKGLRLVKAKANMLIRTTVEIDRIVIPKTTIKQSKEKVWNL